MKTRFSPAECRVGCLGCVEFGVAVGRARPHHSRNAISPPLHTTTTTPPHPMRDSPTLPRADAEDPPTSHVCLCLLCGAFRRLEGLAASNTRAFLGLWCCFVCVFLIRVCAFAGLCFCEVPQACFGCWPYDRSFFSLGKQVFGELQKSSIIFFCSWVDSFRRQIKACSTSYHTVNI